MNCSTNNRRRSAFTLLEVVLALALTVLVTGLIGFAIHLQLRSLDASQRRIERDQLARTLLRIIADDVRATIRTEPFDSSGVMAAAAGQASASSSVSAALGGSSGSSSTASGNSGSSNSGGSNSGGSDSSGGDSGSSDSSTDDTTDETSGSTTKSEPGLYGTQLDIQIDVGRIPRVDELFAASATSSPGDVKTVSYYLSDTQQVAAAGLVAESGTGLMRAQCNRATAQFLDGSPGGASMLAETEMLANEVVGLTFRYLNGQQWFTEWNSETQGGLPAAVEITITLAPLDGTAQSQHAIPSIDDVYRLVVSLPNAIAPDSTSTDTDTSEADSTSQSSGGSSSTAGGN
ncbi:MAG: type II secretion system protein GspJ [Planctomycetota bacterium]|nr:type II secretion system protein GspJ [Planctomycetota bacterium]